MSQVDINRNDNEEWSGTDDVLVKVRGLKKHFPVPLLMVKVQPAVSDLEIDHVLTILMLEAASTTGLILSRGFVTIPAFVYFHGRSGLHQARTAFLFVLRLVHAGSSFHLSVRASRH